MSRPRHEVLERSASQVLAHIARALNTSDDAASTVQEVAESLQRYFRTWTLGIWLDGQDGVLTLEGLALQDDCPPDVGAAESTSSATTRALTEERAREGRMELRGRPARSTDPADQRGPGARDRRLRRERPRRPRPAQADPPHLKLVWENGGELRAENCGRPVVAGGSPGEGGARFIARFPALDPETEEQVPGALAPEPERQRVLIIDDEPTVANVAARYLARAGDETHSAGSAEEALERIERGERYDAIVVDLRMPGMGGRRFHQTVREEHPALLNTIIFASGDIASPSTRAFLDETHRRTLAKPYELAELKAAIEGILEDA